MDENITRFMRVAIGLAQKARDKGNHPFGAILVNEQGNILLEAENTVVTEKDCTGHAETNLMRKATKKYDLNFLANCTLYTSTEPCPMCAGAIYWANVRRVVYGLSEKGMYEIVGEDTKEFLHLPCHEIFEKGRKPIEVIGPILEEEAKRVHKGFWQ